jgi:hypothetical protein
MNHILYQANVRLHAWKVLAVDVLLSSQAITNHFDNDILFNNYHILIVPHLEVHWFEEASYSYSYRSGQGNNCLMRIHEIKTREFESVNRPPLSLKIFVA